MRRLIVGVLVVACLSVGVTAPSFASKGSKTSGASSTLQLVVMNSSDGQAHWNGQITFHVSTTATSRPYVQVDGSQNGAVVYSASAGYFPDYPWPADQVMTLSSTRWTGGAADCSARLYMVASGGKQRTLTTLNFHVYA
jgi:hypothetical protein